MDTTVAQWGDPVRTHRARKIRHRLHFRPASHGRLCFPLPQPDGYPIGTVDQPRALHAHRLTEAGFSHAFFTRCGGASDEPFDSLNFSIDVGDAPERVTRNLALAAEELGVDPDRILFLQQVHGTTTHAVAPPFDRRETVALQGDAVVARDPSVACSVRVADCAPILLADRVTGTVAAVHSGWRGTQQNIVAHVVRFLREYAGRSLDLVAAVGPHIEPCCFEVGHDVAAQLSHASPVADTVLMGPRGRPHVDLRRILHAQLIEVGVRHEQIEHVRGCTVCDARRFFSYRRDGKKSGRLMASIVPRTFGQ